eukprot:Platyproteum_vivax@DN4884_c0_g1_i11.p1
MLNSHRNVCVSQPTSTTAARRYPSDSHVRKVIIKAPQYYTEAEYYNMQQNRLRMQYEEQQRKDSATRDIAAVPNVGHVKTVSQPVATTSYSNNYAAYPTKYLYPNCSQTYGAEAAPGAEAENTSGNCVAVQTLSGLTTNYCEGPRSVYQSNEVANYYRYLDRQCAYPTANHYPYNVNNTHNATYPTESNAPVQIEVAEDLVQQVVVEGIDEIEEYKEPVCNAATDVTNATDTIPDVTDSVLVNVDSESKVSEVVAIDQVIESLNENLSSLNLDLIEVVGPTETEAEEHVGNLVNEV